MKTSASSGSRRPAWPGNVPARGKTGSESKEPPSSSSRRPSRSHRTESRRRSESGWMRPSWLFSVGGDRSRQTAAARLSSISNGPSSQGFFPPGGFAPNWRFSGTAETSRSSGTWATNSSLPVFHHRLPTFRSIKIADSPAPSHNKEVRRICREVAARCSARFCVGCGLIGN